MPVVTSVIRRRKTPVAVLRPTLFLRVHSEDRRDSAGESGFKDPSILFITLNLNT